MAELKAIAEALEGRPVTKENPSRIRLRTVHRDRSEALNGLERIRKAAERDKNLQFTNLMHHITPELLRSSYFLLRKDAATGVDDVTWQEYGAQLNNRLSSLHERVQSGRYRAKPAKRVWLPKPDGKRRPISIAALEDKIVQQAAVQVLNQIYEQDFLGFSYGYRPGKSPHNALDAVYVGITQRKVNWVLDADIRSFFDTIDHNLLMALIKKRIMDPRMLRLIQKWLRAGVSEEGQWSRTSVGTPQGSIISPLLSNIYLHYVLDERVELWRRSKAQGDVTIIRYSDDFVMGFQHKHEAEGFLKELKSRFASYGLEIHEGKTRIIEFGRFAADNRAKRGDKKPETFDFLGFTHICSKTRKNQRFTIRRKTSAKKFRIKVEETKKEIMCKRHEPVPEQAKWLRSVVQGHLNYFAVPGNKQAIDAFRTEINKAWLFALRRRSQKSRNLTWDRIKRLIATWIPKARVLHPYPNQRLCVTTQGRSRMR